jgi:ribosomal protein S18 acetylase RimI-like enzyme
MPEPLPPFRSERYEIGSSRDGRTLLLRPMTATAAHLVGAATAAIDPWAHYGFDAARMISLLMGTGDSGFRYQIECGPDIAGAVVIRNPWLAGPYLQLLAILPSHQRQGIGAAVLGWIEAEARGHYRNLWLCVSAFNTMAQGFYAARGFEHTVTLDALMREGDDEILMRKRVAP